jgi:hypothetical protein
VALRIYKPHHEIIPSDDNLPLLKKKAAEEGNALIEAFQLQSGATSRQPQWKVMKASLNFKQDLYILGESKKGQSLIYNFLTRHVAEEKCKQIKQAAFSSRRTNERKEQLKTADGYVRVCEYGKATKERMVQVQLQTMKSLLDDLKKMQQSNLVLSFETTEIELMLEIAENKVSHKHDGQDGLLAIAETYQIAIGEPLLDRRRRAQALATMGRLVGKFW